MSYRIKLDNEIQSETSNELVAWANYRSLLRRADLPTDTHLAVLECDGEVLHEATVGGKSLSLKIGNEVTVNELLKLLMKKHQMSLADLKALVKKSGLLASNSKIAGWLLDSDKRKYQKMQIDELFALMEAQDTLELGYTPANYKALVKKSGLTNAEFMRKFEINKNAFYANIADVDSPRHRAMSYKSWLELLKKIKE